MILPKTTLQEATILANQIRIDVAERKLVKRSTGTELSRITLSAGVAQHSNADDIPELLRRADACLYAAKHAGRNRVVNESDSEWSPASFHAAS